VQVGLILHAMGFGNSTCIYLIAGEIFGGERFMKPLRTLFSHLENQSSAASAEDLAAVNADGRGLLGPTLGYMVNLLVGNIPIHVGIDVNIWMQRCWHLVADVVDINIPVVLMALMSNR